MGSVALAKLMEIKEAAESKLQNTVISSESEPEEVTDLLYHLF
jgi:hypothetical protein